MRIRILAPAAAMGLALAGCMGGGSNPEHNRSLDSVHQPVVSINNYVYDAEATSGSFSPTELRRISDWLDALAVRYGDRVAIDDAGAAVPRAARDAIAMMIARRGMMLSDYAPITSGEIAPGRIRLVLTRSTARVDGCPNWDTRSAVGTANTTTSNYGCASNANLAAMVADATDLVRGASRPTNDPLTASKAIDAYRTAPPTGAGGLSGDGVQGGGGQSGGGGQ
jgi:pilus assembly protein CpaD